MSDLMDMDILCEDRKMTVKCKLISEPQEPIAHNVLYGKGFSKERVKNFKRSSHLGWAKRLDTQEFIAYSRVLAEDIDAADESRLEELPGPFATAVFDHVNIERALELNNQSKVTNEDGTVVVRPFLPSSMFAQKRNFYTWKDRIISWWSRGRNFYLSKPKYWKRKQNLVQAFARDFPVFQQVEKRLQWLSQIVVRYEEDQKAATQKKEKEKLHRETQAAEKRAYKEEQKAKREAEEAKRFEEDSDSSDSDSDSDDEAPAKSASSLPSKSKSTNIPAPSTARINFDTDDSSDSEDETALAIAKAKAKQALQASSTTKRKADKESSSEVSSKKSKTPVVETKAPSKWARFDDSDSNSD